MTTFLATVARHQEIVALARALPAGSVIQITRACHTGEFFRAQHPPSLAFLADHLTANGRRPTPG